MAAVQRLLAEPLRRPARGISEMPVLLYVGWLLLLCTAASAQDQFLIAAADCEALISWPAFAAVPGAPTSCKQTPCNTVPGATCDYRTGRLTRLDASSRALSGGLPDSWGALTALTDLNLRDNSLTGAVPPSWARMTALTRLDLSGNKLGGALPAGWQRAKFEQLELKGTQLVDGPPAPTPTTPTTPTSTLGPTSGASAPATAQTGNTTAAPTTMPQKKRSNIMSAAIIAAIAAAGGVGVALCCAAVALWRCLERRKAKQAKLTQLPLHQAKPAAYEKAGVKNTAPAPYVAYAVAAGT